ncbi:hypothetical protein [Marinitoga litoralis]|uniref:hypothetical protein n=1 Tax=Marinitoga litoralis TaxID=570855 RepID=UPI00195F50C3|nr:hypothetical protein [Marinitoga litoralis]MBM7559316.1 hypothetical protein [Marinitoga litoralis]
MKKFYSILLFILLISISTFASKYFGWETETINSWYYYTPWERLVTVTNNTLDNINVSKSKTVTQTITLNAGGETELFDLLKMKFNIGSSLTVSQTLSINAVCRPGYRLTWDSRWKRYRSWGMAYYYMYYEEVKLTTWTVDKPLYVEDRITTNPIN